MASEINFHDALNAVRNSKPLSQLNEEEMRAARDLALSILRADYHRDVRGAAESIREAIADGEIPDRDALLERVHEECDGAARVIYTQQAQEALLCSDNASAYVDEYGTEGVATEGTINWSALAFAAFEQDVMEQLDAEGIDVNNYPPEDEEDEDEADDAEDEATEDA